VYDFEEASDGTRRVAFVLHLRREYQLLCRWEDEEEETGREACAELFATFMLF
jgi:hypothetical protein